MNNLKYLSTCLVMAMMLSITAQTSFTLDEAIAYGLKNSNQVKLNQLNLLDADAQLTQYKSIGYPKLNATIDYSHYFAIPTTIFPDFITPLIDNRLKHYNILSQTDPIDVTGTPVKFGRSNTLNFGAGLNAIIYDPAFFQGLKASKLYKDLTTRQNAVTDLTIRESVSKAYLGALIITQNQNVLNQNITNLDKMVKDTRTIQSKGFIEQIDVDRLTLSLNSLKTEAEKLDNMYEMGLQLLKLQMGYPMNQSITLTDQIAQLVDRMMIDQNDLTNVYKPEQRPEFRYLQLADELNNIKIKSIKLGAYPSIGGFASYSYGTQSNNLFKKAETPWFPVAIAGFKLNLPIFDGFDRKSRLDRANIDASKLKLQMDDFTRGMDIQVKTARLQYENAKKTMASTKENVDLAQKIYNQAQAKFKGGVGSTIEINQAEASFLQAQSSYTNALYSLLLAKTDLNKALGK